MDEIEKRLESLIGTEHISEDYVRFTRKLYRAHRRAGEALRSSGFDRGPSGRGESMRSPALACEDIPFSARILSGLFDDICEGVGAGGEGRDELARLRVEAGREPAVLEKLARCFFLDAGPNELAGLSDRLGVPVPTLALIGRMLAVPFCTEAARWLRESAGWQPAAGYEEGHCPMCGAPAALAILTREEGKRSLYCEMCGQRWTTSRLMCPFCGNRDQATLGILFLSDGDARWIETCGECRRFIKTVDERKLPVTQTVIPEVEKALTLHLDMLAENEGYVQSLI